MTIRSLIPRTRPSIWAGWPALALRRDVDRLFDEFFGETGIASFDQEWAVFSPRVDVAEENGHIRITAELPGLDENDVQVTLSQNELTISGEKSREREEKDENRYRMERSYGSFRRSIVLPCEVVADETEASMVKGVLTVKLPKTGEAQGHKQIVVTSGENGS